MGYNTSVPIFANQNYSTNQNENGDENEKQIT